MFGQEITNLNLLKRLPPPDSKLSKPETRFRKSEDLPKIRDYDSQLVSEYISEICDYLIETEAPRAPFPSSFHSSLTPSMRSLLIDWLVSVHMHFNLKASTLFLAVDLVNQFISARPLLPPSLLQLVGLTSLHMAAKIEEIYPPPLRELLHTTEDIYSRAEIVRMEGEIGEVVTWKMGGGREIDFLQLFIMKVGGKGRKMLEGKLFKFARYIIELALLDEKYLNFPRKVVALGALYLAGKVIGEEGWNEEIEKEGKVIEDDIRSCAKELCHTLQRGGGEEYGSVKRKFGKMEWGCVSKIQFKRKGE